MTYVASSSAETTASGQSSLAIPVPSGTASGDLMVALVASYGDNANWAVVVPSGWTLVRSDSVATNYGHKVMYRIAGASEPAAYTFTVATGTYSGATGSIVTYRGLTSTHASAGASGSGTALTAPGVSPGGASVVLSLYSTNWSSVAWGGPSGATRRVAVPGNGISAGAALIADESASATSPPRTATASSASYAKWQASSVSFRLANRPPNAPSWTTPNDTTVAADADYTLQWQFSDPDAGDSQSAFNLKRWALNPDGSRNGAAVTVYQATPNQWYKITAGTLTAGTKYEFQVDTLDSQGAEGPYSSSLFVTAENTPGAPTITDPASGATIGTSSQTFVISTPSLQESEWTLYADDGAGNIDTATILQGPVSVTTGDLRSHTFTGLVNNVPVWASVRIKDGGLWSQPRQQRNPVSYTPPASPVITLTPDAANGSLVVGITNPAGGTATSYNNVYVDDGKGKGKERVATMLPTNTPWTYPWPVSLRDYTGNLWVEAVATNGTTAETVA